MRFCLIHLPDDAATADPEVILVVPGCERTAIAVPLDALPEFLALLDEAVELGEQRCPACDASLPGWGRDQTSNR